MRRIPRPSPSMVIALIALCVLSLGAGAIVLPLSDIVAGLFGRSEIPAIIIQLSVANAKTRKPKAIAPNPR